MSKLLAVCMALLVGGGMAFLYVAPDDAGNQWLVLSRLDLDVGSIRRSVDDWLAPADIEADVATIESTVESALEKFVALSGSAFAAASTEADEPSYRFDEIVRGDLSATVTATGALTPVATIMVGTEVSGQVKEIYSDFNQEARQGGPIALIDPISYEIAVAQAQADLDVARASVEMQVATIERMKAALGTARYEHEAARANSDAARVAVEEMASDARRKEALVNAVSAAERERAQSAYQAALAQLRSAEALEGARRSLIELAEAELRAAGSQLVNFQAVVRQREAALRHAQIELERTVIRSPVDGIVVNRMIEVGQTVAATLDAPTLFTIAQDLRDMQVNASIDESEIGRIAPGQRVEFTVDAFADRRFSGVVEQIRKTPQTVQNVVTYTVIVKAKNPDLLLLPGMTASARFIIAESRDVLTVPNAALRFQPPDVEAPPGRHIWVEERGQLRPIPIKIGLTDGTRTEVSGEGLRDGLQVITGMERPREEPSTAKRLIGIF